MIAYNLFKFDFFFVLKGLRLCVWRTKNISIGGKNLTDIQYVTVCDQVTFIDTIKYYQQSLANLVENCDETECENIKKSSLHFLQNHLKYRTKFEKLTENEKKWIIEYLSIGKGVIPYEKIKSCSDLDSRPEGEFFAKTEFFSSLKNSLISDGEYENVKKFWKTLSLNKLSELNDIYNFQDTMILSEIFENRASEMSKRFPCNPRKCTSTSTLSSCIHRYLSKAIISFPTNSKIVELFEKTLIGRMSCVNTRLAFDSLLLTGEKEQKLIYNIRNPQTGQNESKRVVAKILKMDENNQYRNAMTKPLPTGCIKKSKKNPSMCELQLITEGISHEVKIGHLFVVDLMFDFERYTARELLFNEIYTPVFEKKKILLPSKRSVFQLLDAMHVNDIGFLNAYKATAKTISTMDKKVFIPLYAEQLHFSIKRCGWLVTKIYSHFTFEQAMFKKGFVIMNQVLRQNAKTGVERDFFKLMNNSNFGYDRRNNIDNCFFSPIIDKIDEVRYIRKHQNVFDPSLQDFVSSDLLEKK